MASRRAWRDAYHVRWFGAGQRLAYGSRCTLERDWISWKQGEPYLAAGASPAPRIYQDRIEVAAPRAAAPLRLPLDRLAVHRSTTLVRMTGIPLDRATFVHLSVPGVTRVLSTRTFETPETADQAVAQILCLQGTGRLVSDAPAPPTDGTPPVDPYELRLQAELDRLRRD